MGNKSLSQIKIDGYLERKNNFSIPNLNPDKIKMATNSEKNKMKLIQEGNQQNKDASLIDGCFSKHFFLNSLDRKVKQDIIKEMSLFSARANLDLFKQGDTPGLFYVLKEGTCDVIINGEKKETLQKGSCFGEPAIIYGMSREYGVKTTSECQIWALECESFINLIESILNSTHQDSLLNIGKLQAFSVISNKEKAKIVNNIYKESPQSNKAIYEKGLVSSCIYVLRDGSVTLKKDGNIIKNISKGECFGALEVLANSNRITDAIPSGRTVIYSIPVFWLKSLYGDNYRSVVALALLKSAISNNLALKKLNLNFMDEIFNRFTFKYYEKETEIIRKGEPKNNLFVIPIEGELVDSSNNRTICPRNNILFGKEIFEEDTSKTTSGIKCKPYSLIATLKYNDFKQHFKCSLKELGEKANSIEQLRKVNLFKNFTNQKLEDLSRKIKIEKIPNGKNVITQGEQGTRFYIVKKGFVDIFVGNHKYIRTMNENENCH